MANTNTQLFNNTSATAKQHHTQQQAQKRGRKPRTWSPEVEQELAQAKWAIESRGDQPTASRLLAEFRKPGYPNAYAANFSQAQIQNKLSRENLRTKRNRPEGSSSDEEVGTSQPQLKRGKHEDTTATTSPPNDADAPLPPAALKLELNTQTQGQDDQSRHAIAQTFLQTRQAAFQKTVQDLDELQAEEAKHQHYRQEQLKAIKETAATEAQRFQQFAVAAEHKIEELKRVNEAQAQAAQKLHAESDKLQLKVNRADLALQNALQVAKNVAAERDQLQTERDQLQAERDQLRAEKERLQTLHQEQLKAARQSARNQLQKRVSEFFAEKEDDDSPN